jgi:cytochrome c-type biogenesis protein CcmH
MRKILPVIILFLLIPPSAQAVEPDERLRDPAQEARALGLTRALRCPGCTGPNIDESASPLAADLRHIVREEVEKGRSDAQIRDDLRQRYGDEVLLAPPLAARTLPLWAAPWAALLLGLFAIVRFIRRQKGAGGS